MAPYTPRERKHRRLAKLKPDFRNNVSGDANAEIHVPTVRTRAPRDESEPKVSRQKRKRLEKYIDTKLKKEENLELLKKLATQKIDTSLLQSAKKLGRVQESRRERLQRVLKEREAGVDINGEQQEVLFAHRGDPHEDGSGQDTDEEDVAAVVEAPKPSTTSAGFGSGLKRPLETDDSGQPVIKKRRRRKSKKPTAAEEQDTPSDASEVDEEDSLAESEWGGFSSDEELPEGDLQDNASETGDEEHSEQSTESEDDESDDQKPARVSAFKAWADSQRNEAVGFTPSSAPTSTAGMKATSKPRAPSPDPVAAELTSTTSSSYRPSAAIVIPRTEQIQAARLELPVVQDEQKIMEAIHNNPTTVVCGATGSGKTTQLPQMLLENGYATKGMIGITQPRRVAATSVANRVAFELGSEFGKQVAHQVRYDSNVSRDTKIKFMTDGILLRELSQDFALTKYSVIVIDEAHERSVNTDILIGMLSRTVPLRQELSREEPEKYQPLKLIIMSATLRVADFLMNDKLFKDPKPPIVQAEGRQYTVTEHFARRTQRDYVAETVRKVAKGHRKLPPGSILVFLTGQDEIQIVAKRLKEEFAMDVTGFENSRRWTTTQQADYMEEDQDDDGYGSDADITGLDDNTVDEEFEVEAPITEKRGGLKPHILPLYAALTSDQQMRVFQPPPEGSRAIVLATNVAETSLTIPGVKYVFDCGRSKEKRYDASTGVQEFQIDWISKASASQRMGRAGRTAPGHCWRLYSSAIYEQYFEEHTLPEILRTPIEGTVLQLKNMSVDNVMGFPFPTPPQREQLVHAERLLQNLGAINAKSGKVTDVGKELIHYPVNPRFGKMLSLGLRNDVLPQTIAIVAGLAVGDLFVPQPQAAEADPGDEGYHSASGQAYGRAVATLTAWDDKSDAIKILTAVAAHASAVDDDASFCSEYFLRQKSMREVQQLRHQLHSIAQNRVEHGKDTAFRASLPPPVSKDIAVLKQVAAAGYIDQVAIRADLLPSSTSGRKARRANEVPYRTLLPSYTEADIDRTASLEDQELHKSVFVHGGSVLAKLSPNEMPPYIVYSHLSRATASAVGEKKKRTRMHPLTTVGPKQLTALSEGTPLLEIGKPIGKIEDREGGKKRICWVGVSLRAPGSQGGWPLGAWKVQQARTGKEWVIEKVIDRGR